MRRNDFFGQTSQLKNQLRKMNPRASRENESMREKTENAELSGGRLPINEAICAIGESKWKVKLSRASAYAPGNACGWTSSSRYDDNERDVCRVKSFVTLINDGWHYLSARWSRVIYKFPLGTLYYSRERGASACTTW